jgi:hypothetical protein
MGKDVEDEITLSSLHNDDFLIEYVSEYLGFKIQDI